MDERRRQLNLKALQTKISPEISDIVGVAAVAFIYPFSVETKAWVRKLIGGETYPSLKNNLQDECSCTGPAFLYELRRSSGKKSKTVKTLLGLAVQNEKKAEDFNVLMDGISNVENNKDLIVLDLTSGFIESTQPSSCFSNRLLCCRRHCWSEVFQGRRP